MPITISTANKTAFKCLNLRVMICLLFWVHFDRWNTPRQGEEAGCHAVVKPFYPLSGKDSLVLAESCTKHRVMLYNLYNILPLQPPVPRRQQFQPQRL